MSGSTWKLGEEVVMVSSRAEALVTKRSTRRAFDSGTPSVLHGVPRGVFDSSGDLYLYLQLLMRVVDDQGIEKPQNVHANHHRRSRNHLPALKDIDVRHRNLRHTHSQIAEHERRR